MKIALCISGQLRCVDKTYQSLFYNLLKEYNPDIFISTWDDFPIKLKQAETLYDPKEILIEKPIQFNNLEKFANRMENIRNPLNVLSMYYKIQSCNLLKKNWEQKYDFKYDFVIRWRSDIYLTHEVKIPISNGKSIFVPQYGHYFGVNDQVAIGASDLMDKYSCLFDKKEEYFESGQVFIPEILLAHHLNKENINIEKINLDYLLLRQNGDVFDNKSTEMGAISNKNYRTFVGDLQNKWRKK